MFERFTERARDVIEQSRREALRFNHQIICTEHILLAILKDGDCFGAYLIRDMGIDLLTVRLELEKLIESFAGMITQLRLPLTPLADKAVNYAFEEARNLDDRRVGSEHLLLGLLRVQSGMAAQVLNTLGMNHANARAGILKAREPT